MGRPTGPLFFRLILQPIVATFLAIRAARNDARHGRPAFFCAIMKEPKNRRRLILEAWKHIGALFLVGVGLDVLYQLIVFHGIRPVQSLIVATVLALFPYLAVRGLTNRILTCCVNRQPNPSKRIE